MFLFIVSPIGCISAWWGYKINFKKIASDYNIKVGDTLTYSIYAKLDNIPIKASNFTFFTTPSLTNISGTVVRSFNSGDTVDWQQLSYTFTVTEDILNVTSMRIESSYYENSSYKTEVANAIFACPQLEIGSSATAYESDVEVVSSTIDLTNHEPLRSIDNVYDYIDYENNRIVRNIRHLSLKIKDMNNSETYPGWYNVPIIKEDYPDYNAPLSSATKFITNVADLNKGISINTKGLGTIFINSGLVTMSQSAWKSTYNDLTIELYYKMPTPIYEPLNLPRILINSSSGHMEVSDGNVSASSVSADFVTK